MWCIYASVNYPSLVQATSHYLLIGRLGTNFSEILIEILTFSFKKMRLKVSFAKRQSFCLGFNVLSFDVCSASITAVLELLKWHLIMISGLKTCHLNLETVSVYRCCLTSIRIHIIRIKWSHNCLIFIIRIPIPRKTTFTFSQALVSSLYHPELRLHNNWFPLVPVHHQFQGCAVDQWKRSINSQYITTQSLYCWPLGQNPHELCCWAVLYMAGNVLWQRQLHPSLFIINQNQPEINQFLLVLDGLFTSGPKIKKSYSPSHKGMHIWQQKQKYIQQ